MKKYYIGIIVLAVMTLGFTGFVLTLAGDAKQDTEVQERAQEIAGQLNDYISENKTIPESLDEVGIKDVPAQISYTKDSSEVYTFCVDYINETNYTSMNPASLVGGSALRDASTMYEDSFEYDYKPSSLYISAYHKKGKDCQTVKPYISSSFYNFNTNRSTRNTINPNESSLSASAKDTERETDIKYLHGQVEASYAEEGVYPTLGDINSSAWRKTNMSGLMDEALKDPDGYGNYLASSPAKNMYSYTVSGESSAYCDNDTIDCTKYTLTATLSDGSTYTKEALN